MPVGHVPHDLERPGRLDDRLAAAGGSCGADLVVAEHPGPDEGRVTDPPGDLVAQAAGGGARAQVAVGVDRGYVDRAGRVGDLHLLVGVEPVVAGAEVGLPVQPCLAGLRGQQVLLLEPDGFGERERSLADDEHVVRPPQHLQSDAGGVADVAERRHRAGLVRRAVHDRGVELDDAVLVGQPAVADRHVLGVVLHFVDAGHDRVQRIAAAAQQRHGLLDGVQAVA
jgi:hypothetical protein